MPATITTTLNKSASVIIFDAIGGTQSTRLSTTHTHSHTPAHTHMCVTTAQSKPKQLSQSLSAKSSKCLQLAHVWPPSRRLAQVAGNRPWDRPLYPMAPRKFQCHGPWHLLAINLLYFCRFLLHCVESHFDVFIYDDVDVRQRLLGISWHDYSIWLKLS